jgi:hypothetical protein
MKKLMTLVAAGLITAAVLAKPVQADDKEDAKPPSKPAPKAAVPALTDESLGVLLEQLGYETKSEKTKSGGMIYSIEFDQDGWTFRYDVILSPNKKFLWITTSVCTLSPGMKPSAEAWQKLMEENDRIGPTTISYDNQNRQIRVAVALFNRGGITAAMLREQMGFFTTHVQSVSKLCDDFRAPTQKKPPVDDDDK